MIQHHVLMYHIMDIAHGQSGILFLIQRGMFDPLEALPNHTLSNLCFLVHKVNLKNHLSFQELVKYGMPCLLLPSANPTVCFVSNLRSTSLISSLYLCSSSVFLYQGFVIGPRPFPTSLSKKYEYSSKFSANNALDMYKTCFVGLRTISANERHCLSFQAI